MRLIILLFPIGFGLLAFLHLISKNYFDFFMWSFAATVILLSVLPITFDTKKTTVPIFQIFSIFLVLLAVVSAVTYLDLSKLKIPFMHAVVYSTIAGITLTSVIIALRPTK